MNKDPLNGRPLPVYLYYAVPSTIGLLALSSASLVDAIFVGNYAGTTALAAVNLSMPAISLLFGIAFMLAVGGSVSVGVALGESKQQTASDIFSKIISLCFVIALLLAVPGVVFIDAVVQALGTNDEAHALVRDYLLVTFLGAPISVLGYALYYFVVVDNRPVLASTSLVLVAAVNITFDWVLVAQWQWSTFGAALATISSHCVLLLVLVPHFFSTKAQLRFQRPRGSWRAIRRAALNGTSEFTNEISTGIITLLFNWTLMARFSTIGVAAFTVVEYVMFTAVMLSYGLAEGAQPLISKNLGAKQPRRIYQFFYIALASAFVCNLIMSVALLMIPDQLISVFLQENAQETMAIAAEFARYFWPVPILIGFNVVLTAFFTGSDQPLPSAIIAVSRSMILPATLLLTLPLFLGDTGIYITVPVAELTALLIGLILLWRVPAVLASEAKTNDN